jgi:hypothetical protein
VPFRLDVVPGVVHGFMQMSSELTAARNALREAGAFLGNRLRRGAAGGQLRSVAISSEPGRK